MNKAITTLLCTAFLGAGATVAYAQAMGGMQLAMMFTSKLDLKDGWAKMPVGDTGIACVLPRAAIREGTFPFTNLPTLSGQTASGLELIVVYGNVQATAAGAGPGSKTGQCKVEITDRIEHSGLTIRNIRADRGSGRVLFTIRFDARVEGQATAAKLITSGIQSLSP